MSKILDRVEEINLRNAQIKLGRKRATLDKFLFSKILKGIVAEKTPATIALELEITKDLINDVVGEFEIESPADASKLLVQMKEDDIEVQNESKVKKIKSKKSKKELTVVAVKPPKSSKTGLEGVVFFKPEYDRAKIEKRLRDGGGNKAESKIPSVNERKFKNDIDFGFRRMKVLYGENSELNLDDKALKQEIIRLQPDLKNDKEYFNESSFED